MFANLVQKSSKLAAEKGTAEHKLTFAIRVSQARVKSLEYFKKIATESTISGSKWSFEEYETSLVGDIDAQANQIRKDELAKMNLVIEKFAAAVLGECVAANFNECNDTLWTDVIDGFEKILIETKEKLMEKLNGFSFG